MPLSGQPRWKLSRVVYLYFVGCTLPWRLNMKRGLLWNAPLQLVGVDRFVIYSAHICSTGMRECKYVHRGTEWLRLPSQETAKICRCWMKAGNHHLFCLRFLRKNLAYLSIVFIEAIMSKSMRKQSRDPKEMEISLSPLLFSSPLPLLSPLFLSPRPRGRGNKE